MAFLDLTTRAAGHVVSILGEALEYLPFGSAVWVSARGVFDLDYVEVSLQDGAAFESRRPAAFFRASDLPVESRQKDQVRRAGTSTAYEVVNVQADGQGGVLLLLTGP